MRKKDRMGKVRMRRGEEEEEEERKEKGGEKAKVLPGFHFEQWSTYLRVVEHSSHHMHTCEEHLP